MIKKTYFTLMETPHQPGKYIIAINFDLLPPMRTEGSYAVLFARLMNLSFPQYLRFCRDEFEAEVIGKHSTYPTVYFKKTAKTSALIRLLNSRMNYVVWEREHPDWKAHQDYLTNKEAEKDNVYNG